MSTDIPSSGVPGLHLMGDLHGCACPVATLCDRDGLLQACTRLVEEAGLTVVGNCFHQFGEGGGVTGVVVLAESHLSVHTWPESGFVTLDVYVCNYSGDNRAKAEKLFAGLAALFDAATSNVRRVERG
ncbi:S-adenosylmethionine decarboxylase [Formivibrio citricus]|uniref:S-adenosylmethionine decarboxylase n=1 Tax=Formivibrio citricus TaxID=83765 RepID=A0A1I4V2V1_9NEIS|nr:adenosylmethionine decarboxylase [Formivibrio citricus]SFM95594.1 S-adenosylmethionine decarboxylase [Formivibrio citricus]